METDTYTTIHNKDRWGQRHGGGGGGGGGGESFTGAHIETYTRMYVSS